MAKEYWWISVAGADCEPAVLTLDPEGKRIVHTLGCQDPFYVDDKDSPVEMVKAAKDAVGIPANERQVKNLQHRAQARIAVGWPGHGYRKFD